MRIMFAYLKFICIFADTLIFVVEQNVDGKMLNLARLFFNIN